MSHPWAAGRQRTQVFSESAAIGDKDFLSLPPGESVTFILSRFAVSLKDLPPGTYQARIQFWEPGKPYEDAYYSPKATFAMLK